jgi:hypothetical protein
VTKAPSPHLGSTVLETAMLLSMMLQKDIQYLLQIEPPDVSYARKPRIDLPTASMVEANSDAHKAHALTAFIATVQRAEDQRLRCLSMLKTLPTTGVCSNGTRVQGSTRVK